MGCSLKNEHGVSSTLVSHIIIGRKHNSIGTIIKVMTYNCLLAIMPSVLPSLPIMIWTIFTVAAA